jgi:uncharacterized membrane protein YidH (DUF202 family)
MYNKACKKKGDFMKLNNILKFFFIIFQSSFVGSIILYAYNYYIGIKKYETIPAELQKNLNIFIFICIVSAVLYAIIRFILYIRNKEEKEEYTKVINVESDKRIDIEQPVTERVIIYKDSYDVPKEKRMVCPNCNNIIDKNAFICLKCGFLLNNNLFNKKEEKETREYKNINKHNYEYKINKNIFINIGLIVAIVVCLIMIINIAMERGIIG